MKHLIQMELRKTYIGNVSPFLRRCRQLYRWKRFLKSIYWRGWLIFESKDPCPVDIEDVSKLLPVSFFRRRAWSRTSLLYLPTVKHVMSKVKIHCRPVRDEPIQLPFWNKKNSRMRTENYHQGSKVIDKAHTTNNY